MPTSSEKGIRILDESHYYWVWSAHGPSDQGVYYNRSFVAGMVPCPLPGDIANELEFHGFFLTPYEPGTWFSHWEGDEGHSFHQHPVFAPIETAEPFPPEKLPEKLPQEWVDFFAKYTAGGKLKKEFRKTTEPESVTYTEVPYTPPTEPDGDQYHNAT